MKSSTEVPTPNSTVGSALESAIEIGRVVRPRGVRGAILVRLHNPQSEALDDIERVRIGDVWHQVEHSRALPKGVELTLAGLANPEEAAALNGAPVLVARDALPALAPGEYYLEDLRDLLVVDPHGNALGRVENLIDAAGQMLLEIRTSSGKLCPVPVQGPFIQEVRPGRELVLAPIEGLIE